MTLRRLLVAAGFTDDWRTAEAAVKVLRLTPEKTNKYVFSMTQPEYLLQDGKDMVLEPGDLVEVP